MSALWYLDSSAIVKLVVREAESDALHAAIGSRSLVVSELALTEVGRAVGRRPTPDGIVPQVGRVFDGLTLLALDARLLREAAKAQPAELRALDAIHLVSALALAPDLDALVAYDKRLAEAAAAAGLRVLAPGAAS